MQPHSKLLRTFIIALILFISLVIPALADPPAEDPDGAIKVRLLGREFDPLDSVSAAGVTDGDGSGYYLVQFEGPITPADKKALTGAGARVFNYIPDYTFIVKLDNTTRARVQALPGVRWVGLYQPAYRLAPQLRLQATASDLQALAAGPLEIIVVVFPGEPVAPLIGQIESWGGRVLSQTESTWQSTLKVLLAPDRLADLAAVSGVSWVESAPQWQLHNGPATDIMGARQVWNTQGLYGQGQVVGVADTGLDTGWTDPDELRDDFEDGAGNSRVLHIYDWVGDLAADEDGHGTHVAGSILGNGALSGADPAHHIYPNTSYAGAAPEASLVFQAIGDDEGNLSGIPDDLNDLFREADLSGAKIHNNSWGSAATGMYTASSAQADQYVWDHPDFTIFFSAGNEGQDHDEDGVIDLYSMGSPATAKNVIAVGASENNRPEREATWENYSIDPPMSSDKQAGDPAGLAAFSSRGPTWDGRYKPDLVAPGTWIGSIRSGAVEYTGGEIDANYWYGSGTSMASPLAAGAGTLVRQFYTDLEGITPSAALIKATLVNGATDINPGQYGSGATREIPGPRPTNVAGWGRVNVENSLFPALRVMTYTDQVDGLDTGEEDTYLYEVNAGGPLRVTLDWSDYPSTPASAGGLINDLDLKVERPDGSIVYPTNALQTPREMITYGDPFSPAQASYATWFMRAVRFTNSTPYTTRLQAVSFYVWDCGLEYVWHVFTSSDEWGPYGDPVASGEFIDVSESGGFYIADLSNWDIEIDSGEDFFIAIESFEKQNDCNRLYADKKAMDGRSWYYDHNTDTWYEEPDNVGYLIGALVDKPPASAGPDRVNNLVGVDLDSPVTGVYTVTVSGHNVPEGPQPYALVASWAISGTKTMYLPVITKNQ